MLYKEFLKKSRSCPFCNLNKDEIFESNKYADLILSRAPYVKDHMLVIPKAHKMFMGELTLTEKEDVESLLMKGLRKLHKKHQNVSILYREGNNKEVGKSITHMHFHLIPDMRIGAVDVNWSKRKFLSEKKYVFEIKKLKKVLN